MRFNTFFLDSEHERYQHGWFPDSEDHNTSKQNTDGSLRKAAGMVRNKKDTNLRAEQLAQQQMEQKKKKSTSVSLWDYLDSQAKKFTLFQSFAYHSQVHSKVSFSSNETIQSYWILFSCAVLHHLSTISLHEILFFTKKMHNVN